MTTDIKKMVESIVKLNESLANKLGYEHKPMTPKEKRYYAKQCGKTIKQGKVDEWWKDINGMIDTLTTK